MMLYVSMKFNENILKGFQPTERTRNDRCQFSKGITTKLYRLELRLLCSARRLMMLYISVKFRENVLKGFQVIERTRNDHCQISKGNKYKTVWTRVTILVFCTSSDYALYLYEVSRK